MATSEIEPLKYLVVEKSLKVPIIKLLLFAFKLRVPDVDVLTLIYIFVYNQITAIKCNYTMNPSVCAH